MQKSTKKLTEVKIMVPKRREVVRRKTKLVIKTKRIITGKMMRSQKKAKKMISRKEKKN